VNQIQLLDLARTALSDELENAKEISKTVDTGAFMRKRHWTGLLLLLGSAGFLRAQVTTRDLTREPSFESLGQNSRELLEESMRLENAYWDNNAKLIENPRPQAVHSSAYLVRESSWYALALLLRDAPGDRQRAEEILTTVLDQQYCVPADPWFGTFRRSPEEPLPAPGSAMWESYDPNWREFIGTTFAMILIKFPDRISLATAQRMYASIDRAVEGEIKQKRLAPTYSNVALMHSFLWSFAAEHNHRQDWRRQSAHWSAEVYRLFRRHDAFNEYNSPTYYGVDIYALALWSSYGATPPMRAMGRRMEARLWREIADYYHPGLRNLCGPYDRAYGIDMENYVSLLGVWMRSFANAKAAPLPAISAAADHVADIWFAPHVTLLSPRIPRDAMKKLVDFQGEHGLRKRVEGPRVVTAWIGQDLMYGGEATGKTRGADPSKQFVPATIHWRTPTGAIGWVSAIQSSALNAEADSHGLTLSTDGSVRMHIEAKETKSESIEAAAWTLPGLRVQVASDARQFHVEPSGSGIDVTYSGVTRIRLTIR
jgi:hypothetical protein